MVLDLLGNDTSVRNDTLYLDVDSISFSDCSSVEPVVGIYSKDKSTPRSLVTRPTTSPFWIHREQSPSC